MTSTPQARTFSADFKRFFIRGLVILLPSVLTLWIVVKAYQFVDNTIAEPINRGVRAALVQISGTWEPLERVFDDPVDNMAHQFLRGARPFHIEAQHSRRLPADARPDGGTHRSPFPP